MAKDDVMAIGCPSFNFRSNLDLWDETLREGAERATISPSFEEKVEVAKSLSDIGVKTIVVGMLPEVPANLSLLKELVLCQQKGEIDKSVRFIVISHVGRTAERAKSELEAIGLSLKNVWLMLIHSVSDQQIEHLFPTIANNYNCDSIDAAHWQQLSAADRRDFNRTWLNDFLADFSFKNIGGLVLGMLDYFRADVAFCSAIIEIGKRNDISQMRMVDTAGTCMPHQLTGHVQQVIEQHTDIQFFGHFHNDFGMATANAMVGLTMGLKGVDVSIGGFANRAGHPPLAEVVTSLKDLYDYTIPGFQYQKLYGLSRQVERLYCLIENPTQPITGVITHSVTSGIRTELIKKCPTIFDVINPSDVGADLKKMFGIRSGIDGIRRITKMYELDEEGSLDDEELYAIYTQVLDKWQALSNETKSKLESLIEQINETVTRTALTEREVVDIISEFKSTKKGNLKSAIV
ncbi:hypothetical protein ACFSJ3_02955 [Corallincola platygyrae]|uniref:Pyruvate carboxyltransferase domain-containing protein n=1 Tax=Corallincola platygyrae TaxID=1193278 RepID=A0ABW4XHC0_9GAMM